MAFCYISVSKPHLLKHCCLYKRSRNSMPIYCFCSSSSPHKPPNEDNPNRKTHLATCESQAGMIENGESQILGENKHHPDMIEGAICRMMEDGDWSTRLQNSTGNLVPLFDHKLVYSVLNRTPVRALEFFRWVEGSGFKHDRETHYKMIEILCRDRRLEDAKLILLDMYKKGLAGDEDSFVLLINGYAKSNRKWDIVKKCVKIFLKMEELGVHRTIKSYNLLLEVIVSERKYTIAEKFFHNMLSEGVVPNQHTYTLMISGFCRSSRVETANRFFEDMKSRNLSPDFITYNTMINGYVQVKKMDEAAKLLMEMKARKMEPSLVTYNSMIHGYARVRRLEEVEKLVVEMKRRSIEPSLVTYNSMINGYTLVDKMEDARKLVVEMKGRNIEPDLVTYATLIKGYVAVDRVDDGLKLFEEMKRGRFDGKVDAYLCLAVLKEDCDSEKMSDAQRNVLQAVEGHVERLELLAMRDAVRELSELANRRVMDRRSKAEVNGEGREG